MTEQEYIVAKQMFSIQGMSLTKISEQLKINRKKLSSKLKEDGLYNGKGYSKELIETVTIMLSKGMSITQISKDLKVSRVNLSRELDNQGLRGKRDISKSHMTYDYESELCKNIALDYSNGIKRTPLMKKYNISDGTIYSILRYYNIDINGNSRIHSVDETVFDIIDTEEKAYWLGFLMADGYVYNSYNCYQVSLSLKELDRYHVESFKKFVGSGAPVYRKPVMLNGVEYISYRIDVCSKKLAESLTKLGCMQCKSLILEFPSIPDELVHHFMRGYFDGDGCIGSYIDTSSRCVNPQLNFSVLGTELFLLQYRKELLKKLDLNINKFFKNGEAYGFAFNGNGVCEKIYNFLYKDATIFLERKKTIFNAVLGRDT